MSAGPDMIIVCTVESVEYSFLIYYSVNLRSDVYFPSCSIAVFCTLSPLFVPFGLDLGFRLLCIRLAVHVQSHWLFGRGHLPVVGHP